ncbi:D-glycero-alpha-D-manno-heptose-1,7-bisphosphate 7-phosphatase [Cellulosilyticum ruminicola]|uniref:D-glycero-alpha-D-manno-heptose-1,7-bisphosphate 7-phosphatase n=1 Tax=Cellulosilyticum ruminicola TaxID=425254 RepID=UPI0006CF7A67|nr:HAD family hydrolase [Cellulosilyticum ruminicola]
MNKAVFLDRDGTINVEKNYLYKIEDFEFIQGVPEAIKLLNDAGYLVIVITNQAGIARGYYTEEDMHKLHRYINQELIKYGAHIDAYYFCPHHPVHGIGEYKKDCNCRKPKTGMLEAAIKDFDIDVSKSYMFGDKEWDVEAGERMGVLGFRVDEHENELLQKVKTIVEREYIENK